MFGRYYIQVTRKGTQSATEGNHPPLRLAAKYNCSVGGSDEGVAEAGLDPESPWKLRPYTEWPTGEPG